MGWITEEQLKRENKLTTRFFIYFTIIGIVFGVGITTIFSYYMTENYNLETEGGSGLRLSKNIRVYDNNFSTPFPISSDVSDYLDRDYMITNRVVGISMWPTIYENITLICLKDFTKEELQVGSIITYQRFNDYISHRIIRIEGDVYITQGDNNIVEDNPVEYRQIYCLISGIIY